MSERGGDRRLGRDSRKQRWPRWGVPLLLGAVVFVVAVGRIRASMDRLPYPVCVMISEYPNLLVRGVEDAAIVYEWLEVDGSTRLLAVFTRRTDSLIGPVAPLGLGGADLAYTYGAVVCSAVEPKTQAYIRGQMTPLMVHEAAEKYVTTDQSLQNLESLRYRLLPEENYMMKRGSAKAGGSPAPVVVGKKDDGTEVFRWDWDGRRYRRKVGDSTVGVSALVILHALDVDTGPDAFPDGAFRADGERAFIYAGGRGTQASWIRRLFPGPIVLQMGDIVGAPLPRGPVWFHILARDAGYRVAAVPE